MIIYTCVCNLHGDDSFLCTLLRHKDISPQSQSVILENSFEDDPKLAAELHQTLADFEADLAGKGGMAKIYATLNRNVFTDVYIQH